MRVNLCILIPPLTCKDVIIKAFKTSPLIRKRGIFLIYKYLPLTNIIIFYFSIYFIVLNVHYGGDIVTVNSTDHTVYTPIKHHSRPVFTTNMYGIAISFGCDLFVLIFLYNDNSVCVRCWRNKKTYF